MWYFSSRERNMASIGVAGMNQRTNSDHAKVTDPTIKKRYCQMASLASMCPTAQERKPFTMELAAAKTSAFRGGCSDFLYQLAMMSEMPGTMMASNTPIKKRTAMRWLQFVQATIRRAIADQPTLHEHRYLAEGRRWMRYDEGNIPARAPKDRMDPSQEYCWPTKWVSVLRP
jgi:hypothetical protein